MFGDMVLIQQSPPRAPLSSPAPAPSLSPPYRRRTTSEKLKPAFQVEEKNEKRRASQLVDELLLEIYNRDNCSSLSGYTSATSLRSQKSLNRYSAFDLQEKGPDELSALMELLESHVVRTGSALVRKLKRRDALRRQRDAHCDVISDHLRKRASEPAGMRFSIEPAPGDSGFSQWHSAMRMVAQLPGGIPPEFRRKLWLNLADRHLSSKNVNWPKVERECFSEWSHPADAELGVQIVKDLHRTGCSLFCGEDGQENQALLKRVLLAYARWNKAVGYCQGFNMLAALILQVTEKCETEALKLMIYLIEGVLPESYFADSLRGLSVDMAVFRELLKTRLPRLSRHLDNLQTAAKDGTTSYEPPLTNVFTMQWFLTLFCNCLPQSTVLRVWDLILLEGNEILLRTALAIWQALAERILSVRSADEFYCIMGVLTREILEFGIVDANSLIKAIVTIGPLTELPTLREKYLYNINPWGSTVSSSVETEVRNRQLKVYGRERLALDISALKKQYSKLKQRQRQAHIIFSAAVARQSPPNAPVVAMNHLLLGKRALLPAKRLGPPKGAIPPARQPPTTLHWKDAPRQSIQSSSSSSSDTELCDEPEEPEDVSPLPKTTSPLNGQFQDDNLLQSTSDNLDLMNLDNTEDDSELLSDVVAADNLVFDSELIGESAYDFDTGQMVDSAVDNNQKFVEISDIFDTSASTKESGELFDFGKYGIQSDSEDEGFDFEKFLENRVRCLKQSSVDEESIASSSEDSSEPKKAGYARKNSQRALEIIQENSLILHRILQCQSRLTPSPPVPELQPPDNNATACLASDLTTAISEKEITTSTPGDSVSPQFYYSNVFVPDNIDIATGSIKYPTYENAPSPEHKYFAGSDNKTFTEEDKESPLNSKSPVNSREYNTTDIFDICRRIKPEYQNVEETPTYGNLDFKLQSENLETESPPKNQNMYETSKDPSVEFDALTFSGGRNEDEKNSYYNRDFALELSTKDRDFTVDSETRPRDPSLEFDALKFSTNFDAEEKELDFSGASKIRPDPSSEFDALQFSTNLDAEHKDLDFSDDSKIKPKDPSLEFAVLKFSTNFDAEHDSKIRPGDPSLEFDALQFSTNFDAEQKDLDFSDDIKIRPKDPSVEFDALKYSSNNGQGDTNETYFAKDFGLELSTKDRDFSDDSETRPSFTSILDSEYTRNLEEKYENLILKSSRPTFLDVAASFDKSDSSCGSSSHKYSTSPGNTVESPSKNIKFSRKSPNSENSIKKSPGDGSNFVRSPTSGRIYNPFPVNISSRQNKDVALRLGLYKKS